MYFVADFEEGSCSSKNFTQIFSKDSSADNFSTSSTSSIVPVSQKSNLDSFLVRTSAVEKQKFDIQVARFIYATNCAFRTVDHPEFKKLLEILHPGYHPPNRHQIGNELLCKVYETTHKETKKELAGKTVCMSIDGWSNIRNDSIVCVSVTDIQGGNVYLIDTIDTEDKSHTSDYLLSLLIESIKQCLAYNCTVRSVVTDNAANMTKMRAELAKSEELGLPDILTYGCSAHIMNLLAHDIQVPLVKEHIKKIIKYFRNVHFAAGKYKLSGGKALVLPQNVRWNTLAGCIESYLENWHILCKICSENRAALDTDIVAKVQDMNLKMNAQDYLVKLKKIAIALDQVQKDNCTISECTEIWIELSIFFNENENCTDLDREKFNS